MINNVYYDKTTFAGSTFYKNNIAIKKMVNTYLHINIGLHLDITCYKFTQQWMAITKY